MSRPGNEEVSKAPSMTAEPITDWEGASWEDAERDALRLGAAMTIIEKLRWIEEAEEFGLQFQRRRWRNGEGVDPRFIDQLRAEDQIAAGNPPLSSKVPPPPFVRPAWAALLE